MLILKCFIILIKCHNESSLHSILPIYAVFTHHYNTLLLNMPVRHMISRLQLGDRAQLAAQLRRIVSLEVRNFFVLAE